MKKFYNLFNKDLCSQLPFRNLSGRRKLNKKSAIEIQFNWIFVMIAGIVIFIFIISVLMKQSEESNTKISQDVLKQISTNIKAKQQLSNTFTELEIPRTTMTFTCDDTDLISDFKISDSQREQLPVEIIFAPREFNTQILKIWTQDFSVPFIVTRFIYITTPGTVFIIYNSSEDVNIYARAVYDEFPSNITRKYAENSMALDKIIKSYKSYKIICFDNYCPTTPANKYNYIKIIPNNQDIFSYGTISFSSGLGGSNDISYMGKASLFGALFSDNRNYYECQMKRAFNQFEIKRTLHETRIYLMESDLSSNNPSCVPLLASPKSTLSNMKDMKEIVLTDASSLYSAAEQLRLDNVDLTFKGCPLIY